jgi:hypothetical protein
MSETEKPKGNWVEQAVAKVDPAKLPPPVVEEAEIPAVETVAEQPEPKVEAPEVKADDDDDDTPTMVDSRALKAERGKRKQWEKVAREREIETAKLNERFALIQQAWEQEQTQRQQQATQQAPAQAQAPDRDTDPLGYLEHQIAERDRKMAEMEQRFAQQTGGLQQQQQVKMLADTYKAAADQFKSATPDFLDAYNDLYGKLDKELELQGMGNVQQRQQHLMNSELQFVATQLRMGKNPAQAVYEMAQLRGYRGKAAEAPPAPATEQVALQNKRQEAMSPLSNAGGKPPSNGMSLKDLASLSNEDFAKATKGKDWLKQFRAAGSR